MNIIDFKLTDFGTNYDISLDDNGDFSTTNGLDTSLLVSIFTDKRADISEVVDPLFRRGWWGTLFNVSNESELGSKLWLLDQTANTDQALNRAKDYIAEAYQWLLFNKYADTININGTSSFDSVNIEIQIIKNNDIITKQTYNLWNNTLESIDE